VPASVNRGTPIVLSEPRHAVSQALKTLAHDHVRSAMNPGVGAPVLAGAAGATRRTSTRRFLRRSEA